MTNRLVDIRVEYNLQTLYELKSLEQCVSDVQYLLALLEEKEKEIAGWKRTADNLEKDFAGVVHKSAREKEEYAKALELACETMRGWIPDEFWHVHPITREQCKPEYWLEKARQK